MITETTSGKVEGFVLEDQHVFLGIPYAAPPLGENRFGAPAAHEPWSGTRECFAYGPTAPQRDPGITIIPEPVEAGDDFLNLNIYTPDISAKLPVFVWIHGGGFVSGCNRSPWYVGTRFARDGVVVVSIGYRLGVEGFLEIEGAPSNRAVLDWVAALEWVRDNIANFGGDPSRVTIGGQSAGSAACITLMVNPKAKGLFHRVIGMSGTSDSRMPPEAARDLGRDVAKRLGVRPTREDLSRFTPDQLVEAHLKVARNPFTAAALMKGFDPKASGLRPFADGETIPEHPFKAIIEGAGADVALLAGSTTEEVNGAIRMQRANLEGDQAMKSLESMKIDLDAYKAHVGTDDLVEPRRAGVDGPRVPRAAREDARGSRRRDDVRVSVRVAVTALRRRGRRGALSRHPVRVGQPRRGTRCRWTDRTERTAPSRPRDAPRLGQLHHRWNGRLAGLRERDEAHPLVRHRQ